MTLQNGFLKTFGHLMKHLLIAFFHLSNLLQMQHDHRKVDIELFSNFLHSCKRISFDDASQLVIVNFQLLATVLLIFKTLVSLAKLLEPLLHVVDIVICLCCFMPIVYSDKKIAQICFLSNIISIV